MGAIVIGLAARYGTREAGEPATVLLPFAADFENVTVGEVRPVTPVWFCWSSRGYRRGMEILNINFVQVST